MIEETSVSKGTDYPSIFSSPIVRYGLVLCFIIPIALHALNTRYSRFVADDYCHAASVDQEGILGSVSHWYETWTGNYTSSLLQGVYLAAGGSALNIMLFAFIVFWWIGIIWLIIEVGIRLRVKKPIYAGMLMGTALLFATIEGMPNVYDTLYWAAGAISHITPLIVLCYYLAFLLLIQRLRVQSVARLLTLISVIPFTLVMAGFSPASTAQLITLLVIIIIYNLQYSSVTTKRTLIPILIFTLITAFLALYVINSAPGTEIRAARFPPTPALSEFISLTITYTASFYAAVLIVLAPFTSLMIVLLSGLVAYYFQPEYRPYFRNNRWQLIGIIFALGTILIAASFSTGVYGMTANLPARAYTTPLLTFMVMMAAIGYVFGMSERARPFNTHPSRVVVVLFTALIILGPAQEAWKAIQIFDNLSTFATEWDANEQEILAAKQSGETDIMISGFSFDLGDIAVGNPFDDNPNSGVNVCAARYYGVDAIRSPYNPDDESS